MCKEIVHILKYGRNALSIKKQGTKLFREIQAWCKDLTVNQWLGEFDTHTRSQIDSRK
jgi:hypothetical protein